MFLFYYYFLKKDFYKYKIIKLFTIIGFTIIYFIDLYLIQDIVIYKKNRFIKRKMVYKIGNL
jgi:hypothetical protein